MFKPFKLGNFSKPNWLKYGEAYNNILTAWMGSKIIWGISCIYKSWYPILIRRVKETGSGPYL